MNTSADKAGWLGNLSVQTKMLLAFGSMLLLLVFNSMAFLFVQGEQAGARAITVHTYQVLNGIDDLLIQALNQQAGLRGYLLTGDDALLEPYRQGRKAFTDDVTHLRELTADNPAQQGRIGRVGEVIEQWQTEVAEPALAQFATDRTQAVSRLVTGKIHFERLRSVLQDTRMAEEQLLARRSADLDRVVVAARLVTVGLLVLGIAVLVLAVWLVQRQVTSPLVRLTGLMTRLADRDHSIEVTDLGRRDEIGALARTLQVFKRMVIDTDRANWVKTNAAEVSNNLQQAKTQQGFAETLTGTIAPLLKAGVAVFYAAEGEEGDSLELLGSYGYRQRRHLGTSYRLGEGLVGQCARERKTIILESVPDDYTRIHSGTGEAAPSTVIVLPVLSQDRLLGVMEFASFGRFAEQHQQLLEELLPVIALSLENLSRAIRTQQLLEETQAQSEELQASEEALRAQQEELRASNEALQSKTTLLEQQSARLQASEEELRVQSEELQASNEELRQKGEILSEQKKVLEAMQHDTQQKADELARASQYKSDFLANMSHELRTPLNSLLILARGLADNDSGNLAADEVESAQVIHDSGSNLLRLINDILDLSKVEAGKMELSPEDLALEDFSSTLARNFRHVAKEKGLGFQINLAAGLPRHIHVDAGKLEQIANNLLSNAFKFTKQGSVTVDIGRPAPGSGRDGDIAIRVTDTGIGIPADKFARVFQAFEQVNAGTSRHYGGTGLGLSIARGMAQLMGGDIRLESEAGKGTSFTLLLPERFGEAAPVNDAAPATPAPPPSPAPAPAATRIAAVAPAASIPDDRDQIRPGETVILIVEDDPAFAKILLDMIRRKGYRGLVAMDGETGLQLAGRYRPGGILLDVMLPGMDGWTVIGRLKSEPGTRHIPVHFISATEDHSRGMDLGAVGFLTKPVTREGLGAAFDRLLHFAAGRTRRVLVVDDDAAARMAVRKLIAAQEIDVAEAEGGEQALAMLEQDNFDCVILDLGMPGMDGFEFLDRAGKAGPVPPVVVYSGRELSREENLRLRQYTDSIVIKGARSPERLLDEVSLFLHSVRDTPLPAPAASREPEGDHTLNDRTVLLVDDDMRNIFALSKALRAKGLKVVMAQDGHKAIRQLEENEDVELVLMDIMMPGMDGYETMREIRKNPRHARLPMIALTAKAMRGDREKCLEAGASDYLSKPVDLDKLFSLMRVWLGAV